ncbi:MAG: DUF1566 domain-containing protein [Methylococcales bacterium]|nr:DUF1566 domain-containing protein [Methylococcales bacterium]MDD5754850.1 DUF1566 domain-containing protein [Methylococcales bacterium]
MSHTLTYRNYFFTLGLLFAGQMAHAVSAPVVNELNDTGVTAKQCYQAKSSALVSCTSAKAKALNKFQDGMIGRDTKTATNNKKDGLLGFSFTKIDSTGAVLPVTASSWACVKDNETGLIWENKTNDFGLHDGANTYTHFSSAEEMAKETDVGSFVKAVNQEKLCGASDWQLPSAQELESVVDYGVPYPGPTIDTAFFPNTQPKSYWASEYFVGKTDDDSPHGWVVTFDVGFVDDSNLKWASAVRLVRYSVDKTVTRYTPSADGQEVKDNKTGLVWRRCAEGMKWSVNTCVGEATAMTHEAALQQATKQATSTVAWRLPNVRELFSIIDNSVGLPAVDSKVFPATPSEIFWSSSPNVANLNVNSAWYVAFDDGDVNDDLRSNTFMVRLVRDGK